MDVSDIVSLVAGCLSQNDQARLAQASRLYFQLVIPLSWRTVTGATQLFRLLPGMRVDTPGVLTGTETIYLPRNLNTVDFARFEFYAKFVEHLSLFKNPAVVIKFNEWGELLRYTSYSTLLPSLSSITLETYWPQSIPHYAWLAIFSSPSVRRIEINPLVRRNLPTVSSETASAIFNLLIDKCPNLDSFSIFVDRKQRTSPLETGFLRSDAYRHETTSGFLGAIKHVRRLTCTSSMAEYCQNTLLLLGRIPKLEDLQLYASQQDDINMSGISLEPEAFSWLRSLTLYDFGPHATLSILNNLASTADLTQLALEINHITKNSDEASSIDRFYNAMLIPAICAQAPRLTHLSIRPMWDDKSQVEINDSSLQLLASLDLKSFASARSHTNVEHLAQFFPRVQTLRWPDQPVTFEQLKQFATYDQLEHLSLKLDLFPPDTMKPLCDRTVPPGTACILESDYSSLDGLNHDKTKQFLKCLARLGSRPLVLQQTAPFDYPDYDFAAKRRLEQLNKELEKIRQGVEI